MRNLVILSTATDAEILSCDIVVTEFSRAQVTENRVEEAAKTLERFSSDPTVARNLRGSMFLSFSGWDDDLREIHDIPEIKTFFRALTECWPYWFYFLEAESHSVKNGLFLLLDAELHSVAGSRMAFQCDPKMFARKAMYLFEHMNSIMLSIGLTEADIEDRTKEVELALAS